MQFEFKLFEDAKPITATVEVEEWRQLAMFPRYDVSTFGRFRNRLTGLYMKPTTMHNGYLKIGLMKSGKQVCKLCHRLVAMTFIEQPSPKHDEVNHKNKDRGDNRVSNLEWLTRSLNQKHAQRKSI